MIKVLIVNNVQTVGNPALWFFYNQLKDHFIVSISAYDKFSDSSIDYKTHSDLYEKFSEIKTRRLFAKLYSAICRIYLILNRTATIDSINYKLRLYLLRFEFTRKNKGYDFIINIDTEASFISSKKKIPSAFNIYEIYAEQTLEGKSSPLYESKTNVEKLGVKNSTIVFSGANEVLGEFLLSKYNIQKKVIPITQCPEKTFGENIAISDPLKLYYHGAYFKNRGLEELVLAMKNISRAVLYLRGYGPLESVLRDLVDKNELSEKVIFLAPVATEKLAEAAAEFDIGLTMARMNVLNHIYAVGFKTFENLSAGLALVLPATYPLKKLNETYNLGLVYEDATVENLIKVITYCINNREQVKVWKNNAKWAYKNQYNPITQKERLIREIEMLTKSN